MSIVPWKSAARSSNSSSDFGMNLDESLGQEQMKSTLYNMTVPVTTRPMAQGEVQGRDYFFVSVQEFEEVRLSLSLPPSTVCAALLRSGLIACTALSHSAPS